ncbi:MAG: DMT family transporter, partial [Anaerolineae bacterium]|nr:DMT family transporter [Anaerolineae bacterium]
QLRGTAIGAVSLGLSAAIAWGASDFTGGYLSRRTSAYGVVIGSEIFGLLLLIPLIAITGEPVPPARVWLLGGLAGVFGSIGLVLLYRALATGQMSIAAPVSALVGAAIPVVVGMIFQGLPGITAILGIGLALAAIMLVSYNHTDHIRFNFSTLAQPLGAGAGFGLFFVLLHQAGQDSTFWPIVATRLVSVLLVAAFALKTRQPWIAGRAYWLPIALIGLLDTSANLFYVIAGQQGRLDFTAVLGSLYPAPTILLAWLILKERVSAIQRIGIVVALFAIMLIVM